ncbi:hypothetical protein AUR04nite_16500 [Glutamicibacter uratoxydans]|uniref:DUF998 domain-containing protein n=1 Tax=Glutamicibacter uratoxydans TaxID=43667 RepID=A0A4Y4DRX2_GLUUR|nr:DUF998 domain-containing protein [Glutamicibacter uratoxydans]GED06118.1 hypothetical protein AUR04nite_16500 [Glutamicibacter uratoxydans]
MNKPSSTAERIESRSTTWAVIAFAVSMAAVAALFGPARRPLAGAESLGSMAAWFATVFTGLGFAASYYLESRHNPQHWRESLPWIKRCLDLVALAAAIMMLCHLLIVAVSYLFQIGFVGLDVDRYGGAVLAAGTTAAMTYIGVQSGSRVNSQSIAQVAIATAFVGTMASMIAAPDQAWWEWHFSALGNSDSASGARFNLTLTVTGLAVTALANYVGHDLSQGMDQRGAADKKLVTLLSWLLAGIGLCMMGVGLVPDAQNTPVHVGFASGMVLLFAVFSYFLMRRVPGIPKDFMIFSGIVVAAVVVSVLLWVPIGYYNLTGMEFVAAGFLFSWLIVFVRTAAAYGREAQPGS